MFIEFEAAFDHIDRNALYYKLYPIGISSKCVIILKVLYKRTESGIWNGKEVSEGFETGSGVKQGCLLSPSLIFLNDLISSLNGGGSAAYARARALHHTDDILLLVETPNSLQDMINSLSDHCAAWNLKVNLCKSKVQAVRGGTNKWLYRGEQIEIATSYRYLGVLFSSNLSLNNHIKNKLTD